MANKGIIAGGIVGIVALGGAAAYFGTRKPTPSSTGQVLTTITLSPSSDTIQAGGSVTFTATALDQNGNPMSGVSLTLFDQSTSASVSLGSTNSSGVASATVVFPSAGTFVLYAED